MIIHLIGSMREFEKDVLIMKKITKIVEDDGSEIALNWVAGVHDRKTRGSQKEQSLDWPAIVEENIEAIAHADALIVEGSRFNYSQGYQTALALQQDKPVLNLYREDLPEYKEWPDKFFVSGVSHPLFTSKPYENEEDLDEIVTEFLKSHSKKTHELDVKIALDDAVYKKLEELSRENNKSKAGMIKDILSRNIQI